MGVLTLPIWKTSTCLTLPSPVLARLRSAVWRSLASRPPGNASSPISRSWPAESGSQTSDVAAAGAKGSPRDALNASSGARAVRVAPRDIVGHGPALPVHRLWSCESGRNLSLNSRIPSISMTLSQYSRRSSTCSRPGCAIKHQLAEIGDHCSRCPTRSPESPRRSRSGHGRRPPRPTPHRRMPGQLRPVPSHRPQPMPPTHPVTPFAGVSRGRHVQHRQATSQREMREPPTRRVMTSPRLAAAGTSVIGTVTSQNKTAWSERSADRSPTDPPSPAR